MLLSVATPIRKKHVIIKYNCVFINFEFFFLPQNTYEKQKEVWAAQGVKVLAKDLEKSLAGLPLLIAHKDDEIAVLKVWILVT